MGVLTLSEGDRAWERRAELNHQFVVVKGTFRRIFNGPEVIDLYQGHTAGVEQDTIQRSNR